MNRLTDKLMDGCIDMDASNRCTKLQMDDMDYCIFNVILINSGVLSIKGRCGYHYSVQPNRMSNDQDQLTNVIRYGC